MEAHLSCRSCRPRESVSTLHTRLSRKARAFSGALTVEYAAWTSLPLQILYQCQLTSIAGPRRRSSQGFASGGEEERVACVEVGIDDDERDEAISVGEEQVAGIVVVEDEGCDEAMAVVEAREGAISSGEEQVVRSIGEEQQATVVAVVEEGRGEVMSTDRVHLLSQTVEEKRGESNEEERGESKGGATESAVGSPDPGKASSC